jgi:hypothetical protein
MVRLYSYSAEVEQGDESGFVVSFPDVPEAITEGDTRDDALDPTRWIPRARIPRARSRCPVGPDIPSLPSQRRCRCVDYFDGIEMTRSPLGAVFTRPCVSTFA